MTVKSTVNRPTLNRRQVMALPLALGLPSVTLGAANDAAPRFALLVGNRVYPSPFDLPPVHKNLRDVQAALEKRGFKVSVVVDQDIINLTIDALCGFGTAASTEVR